MRNRDVLIEGFEELISLLRYLYMSNEHKVVVDNGLCKLEIGMTDNMSLTTKNLNFPDLPEMKRDFELKELFSIINYLKTAKAENFPKQFENRWEEINSIQNMNLALSLNI